METTPTAEPIAVDLDQIIRDLDTPWTGTLPVAAIRAAQAQRGVIVPRLIQAIRDATRQARAGAPPEGDAHFFALFLLTEFQAQEALPAILEAVSIPGETPFDLFGDAVTETLRRILAMLGAESLEALDALISNSSLNEYVRWAAAGTYLYLVRDGRLTREETVARLRTHLDADKTGGGIGLPVLVALCGALLGRNTRGGTIIVGALNLGGSVELIPNAVQIAELSIDKQAQTLLMPVSARRQLNDLPDELWTKINIEFYKDAADAVFKALEG